MEGYIMSQKQINRLALNMVQAIQGMRKDIDAYIKEEYVSGSTDKSIGAFNAKKLVDKNLDFLNSIEYLKYLEYLSSLPDE